jgi:hypothetical protein
MGVGFDEFPDGDAIRRLFGGDTNMFAHDQVSFRLKSFVPG